MAYVIKERRRTSCPCACPSAAQVTPGAALRAAGFFQAFPACARTAATAAVRPIQPRVPEPFYDGPCGTLTEVADCCQSNDFYPTYGYFTQAGPLLLGAGEAIPFDGVNHLSPTGVRQENGAIVLAQPGTYRVAYTINLPDSMTANTAFSLTVDDVVVPGTLIRVVKAGAVNSAVYSAEAIITTDRSTILAVVTNNAIEVPLTDTFATLALHRIA